MATDSPSVNARGIHLRNLRKVFNAALDDDVTTAYPYRRYRVKTRPTRHRALSIGQMRLIASAELPPHLCRWRDLFMLTFMLIGINFKDLCLLAPSALAGGRIEYERAKTHKPYSVWVTPQAMALIDRWRGTSRLLRYCDANPNYRDFYQLAMRGLNALTAFLNDHHGGDLPKLTTYYARHSWATIAASLDIPKETIAHALGHGGNSVTDIYIDFDMRKVDEANRRVIAAVYGE